MHVRTWQREGRQLAFTELGFGAAPIGNLYRAVSDEEADAVLSAVWDSGCRVFDTAPLYGLGLSETRLNRFLRDKARDSYVLATKVGRVLEVVRPEERTGIGKFFDVPSRRERYDYSRDGVLRSFEASLERLGLDRVDILHVHDLDLFTHGTQERLDAHRRTFMQGGHQALVELRDQGVIAAVGGGINEWESAAWLAERGDFDLFLLAGRYTLLEQEALENFLPMCAARGIGLVIGGPFNSGILATGARPGAFYNYVEAPPAVMERVARIETVAARHGIALATAALQFPLRHSSVVSVIPGAQTADQAFANRAMLEAEVPPALWVELKAEGLVRADAPV
ncbi:MAG: aldo/keto reductase [Mesorhizobium sp.]